MRVAVTGAGGFLGRDIVRELSGAGHRVVRLVRHLPASGPATSDDRAYDLEKPLDGHLLDGVDAVVHCAFARGDQPRQDAYRINVDGTRALHELARASGARFVFLSSLSATDEAQSIYGKQKRALERVLAPAGACIVRPGLITGDGGLTRSLIDTMRLRHFVPLVDGGGQPVQTVWQSDVSALVRALVERGCPATTLTVAAEPALTIRRLAMDIRHAFGLRAAMLPVPFAAVYALAASLEAIGLTSPLSTENLLGLRATQFQAPDDVRPFGVDLISWEQQLARLVTEVRV